MRKKVIIGMGNEYCGNDSIGIIVARCLAEDLKGWDLKTGSFSGIDFIEAIEGYDEVMVVDGLYKDNIKLGWVYEIKIDEFTGVGRFSYLHSFGLFEAIQLARELKLKLPEKLRIFGIGIDKRGEIGEKLNPLLSSKIKEIAEEILKRL